MCELGGGITSLAGLLVAVECMYVCLSAACMINTVPVREVVLSDGNESSVAGIQRTIERNRGLVPPTLPLTALHVLWDRNLQSARKFGI